MDRRVSMCKGCHAEIRWAVTQTGKKIPLDAHKSVAKKDGDLLFDSEGNVFAAKAGEEGYKAHFATCPMADQFRKRP
jgi:predicted methyltransferase